MGAGRWKPLLIVLVVGVSIWSATPLKKKINLGLDLQGGIHLVLEVQTDKAVENTVEQMAEDMGRLLRENQVRVSRSARGPDNSIEVVIIRPRDMERAAALLKDFPVIPEEAGPPTLRFRLRSAYAEQVKDNAVSQALETIRNRVDQFGVAEPVIQRQGGRQILIQLSGIKDPQRALRLIGRTAQLEFRLVDASVSQADTRAGRVPADSEILSYRRRDSQSGRDVVTPIVVKRRTLMTGEHLTNASVSLGGQFNQPIVNIRFDRVGGRRFARITGDHVGERLAIVLDNVVRTAPVIRAKIEGGSAIIEGIDNLEEAKDVAIVLRAGALPAPVEILENRTVGPSLGADSVRQGLRSIIIGSILVIVFMVFYYRFSGSVADIALMLNLIILVGAMGYLRATLTLPGIAGIILTIGMAVDANVLIFERIREELRTGKSVKASVEAGFSKAFWTIFDANVTTFIAALVLFQFGTGTVKGFAVTLSIGIAASMFTALFVSRVVFDIYIKTQRVTKLSI
ncbi:MAG: protein translocase subunit SecD [Nitrospinae bacterium]|nr:protein translocase subunit SecD [Nitrospinota bacterium]